MARRVEQVETGRDSTKNMNTDKHAPRHGTKLEGKAISQVIARGSSGASNVCASTTKRWATL
jgi:hypothetical protein